jgi:hypothetical protein
MKRNPETLEMEMGMGTENVTAQCMAWHPLKTWLKKLGKDTMSQLSTGDAHNRICAVIKSCAWGQEQGEGHAEQ